MRTCATFAQFFAQFWLELHNSELCKSRKRLGFVTDFTWDWMKMQHFPDFAQLVHNKAAMGLKARGHGRIRGCLETVSWTRILQNGPCGHLHAIMRACMRSDAGTGDCAPTLAWRAHVWSPASFVHKIEHKRSSTRYDMVLEHDKLDPSKAHAWRTHVHMTHAQKFEVRYRRASLGPTALSCCIHVLM